MKIWQKCCIKKEKKENFESTKTTFVRNQNAERIYIETKYFFNSGASNESVNAYCWSSSVNRNNGWPGLTTTWVEDLADSKKIFYFDVDVSLYDRVLFTKLVNDSFSLKTADIQMSSFESNNTVYLNADSWSDSNTGIPVGFYNRS